MKQTLYRIASILSVFSLLVIASPALAKKVEIVAGSWTITAPNPIVFSCGTGTYSHTLNTVTQDTNGDFTGTGTYDSNNNYTWNINGNVSGSNVTFVLVYTGVNSGYTLTGTGVVAENGSISGTTDGNCQAFVMPEDTATRFEGNHGQYVKSQNDKQAAAQSRIGMPTQSKGHNK